MDRETFLNRTARKLTTDIPLSDGATVKARKLSQAEVEQIKRDYATEAKALRGFRYVVCKTLLDDTGERMFADGDIDVLAGVEFDDIKTIAAAVTKFSGLETEAKND